MVAGRIAIRGSFVGRQQDMAKTLAFAADGRAKANIGLQPHSAANGVLDRLGWSAVASRVVLDFATASACRPAPTIMGESR